MSLNVAVAVVIEAQRLGLAGRSLGLVPDDVQAALRKLMWSPPATAANANSKL